MILAALNDILVTYANLNPLVNEAFAGDVYEVNAKENKFGCFVATPMTALRSEGGTITYTYTLYYIDRLTKDEKNMDFVQSDAVTMLKGLIDKVEGEGVEVGEDYQFTLFRHNFDDWCAGAYVSVDFTVPDTDCGEFDYGMVVDLRPITIRRNGRYVPEGFDGFNEVLVDVEGGGPSIEEIDEEIDKKLVGYATEVWVEGKHYLTQHQDLSSYAKKSEIPSLNGYATQSWVEGKHYLTQHQSLADYAKKSEIPGPFKTINGISIIGSGNIDVHGGGGGVTIEEVDAEINTKLVGYATESWVEGKGYLTEHQSLVGYATESWVEGKGYLTEHQSLKTINGESIIGSGDIIITGGSGVGKSEGEGKGEIFNVYEGSDKNRATGTWSHAEGNRTYAQGKYSHTEGGSTTTEPLARYSHAEGYATNVYVVAGHAEGKYNWILSDAAEGCHAEGSYNKSVPNAIHMVGVGTDVDNPKNGHLITINGKHYIPNIGGYEGTEADVTNVQDVATVINGKMDSSSIWTGTQAEWDELTEEQKSSYTIALVTE